MSDLLVRVRATLEALWDCTCPPKWVGGPGSVAPDLNRYDRCDRCNMLAELDAAIAES